MVVCGWLYVMFVCGWLYVMFVCGWLCRVNLGTGQMFITCGAVFGHLMYRCSVTTCI